MTDLKRIIRRLEHSYHYRFPEAPKDEDDRPHFADAVVLQMPQALRCAEETKHCKSKTKRRIKEVIKEIPRDQPREECAGDEHRHQHQPEDRFGFVIIPYVSNPFSQNDCKVILFYRFNRSTRYYAVKKALYLRVYAANKIDYLRNKL